MLTHDSLYKGNAYHFLQDSLNTASRYQIIYEKLGDYKQANAWGNKYRQLRDTLFNRKIKESMLDYNARYKALERESEIKILKADKEKSELAVRNTRLVVFLVAFILLLVIIMIFKNQQKNKRLLEQQEINNKQKLLEEQQKQQLRSMDAMLQGEEKERNRLSRICTTDSDRYWPPSNIKCSIWRTISPIPRSNRCWGIWMEPSPRCAASRIT